MMKAGLTTTTRVSGDGLAIEMRTQCKTTSTDISSTCMEMVQLAGSDGTDGEPMNTSAVPTTLVVSTPAGCPTNSQQGNPSSFYI